MSGNKEAFFCGISGAVGSLCGKLALSDNSTRETCSSFLTVANYELGIYCTGISFVLRALFFFSMLACNAFMLSNFLIALEKKGSLMVVVVSSSTNIIMTGLIGQFIFGENVGDNWYAGASVMSIGVALIAFSQDARKDKTRVQTDENKSAVK